MRDGDGIVLESVSQGPATENIAAFFCAAGNQRLRRHLFVVGSLDKQMQNERELIRLASAGVGGLFFICVESINLT